jgi:hypothetical protein
LERTIVDKRLRDLLCRLSGRVRGKNDDDCQSSDTPQIRQEPLQPKTAELSYALRQSLSIVSNWNVKAKLEATGSRQLEAFGSVKLIFDTLKNQVLYFQALTGVDFV